MRKHKNNCNLTILIVALIISISLLYFASVNHEKEITKQVQAINGEIVSIDTLGLFENDPLPYGGKGSSKYKFTYIQNNQIKTGYVLFGFKNVWIMNKEKVD